MPSLWRSRRSIGVPFSATSTPRSGASSSIAKARRSRQSPRAPVTGRRGCPHAPLGGGPRRGAGPAAPGQPCPRRSGQVDPRAGAEVRPGRRLPPPRAAAGPRPAAQRRTAQGQPHVTRVRVRRSSSDPTEPARTAPSRAAQPLTAQRPSPFRRAPRRTQPRRAACSAEVGRRPSTRRSRPGAAPPPVCSPSSEGRKAVATMDSILAEHAVDLRRLAQRRGPEHEE